VSSFPLKHRIATTGFKFEEKPQKRGLNKERADELNIPICDYHWIKEGKDWTADDGTVIPNDEITFDAPKPLSYAFASDTMYVPETAKYVQEVTLLYHESTFCEDKLERAKQTMHATAVEAATVAQEAQASHLLIGHFSARYRNLDQFETEAKTVFKNTLRARELHNYKVSNKGITVKNLRATKDEE
jgi:ribonuclease Z